MEVGRGERLGRYFCGSAVGWRRFVAITSLGLCSFAAFVGAPGVAASAEAPEDDPYCTVNPDALKYMAPGTRKMASLLEKLAREMKPSKSIFLSADRAAACEHYLSNVTNEFQRAELRGKLGRELLNAGRSREALAHFDPVYEYAWAHSNIFGAPFLATVARYRAVAHLRLAEEQNCLTNHSADSCIFPIQAGGIHKLQTGSRRAMEILQVQLGRIPADRAGAWLLNIAAMTLGEYPDSVPQRWQIPPEVFKSDFDIGPFHDVASNLGLDVNDLAGGTIAEDFDNDGDLDIMMSEWSPRGRMHYFVNNADGTFSDQTVTAGLSGGLSGLHIVQGDYNNDGLPDVLILRGGWQFSEGRSPDSLLRNDGKNHFTDVTEEAGLLSFSPDQTGGSTTMATAGWTSTSGMNPPIRPKCIPARSTEIIAMELSPNAPRRRALRISASSKA
jgi:hypothetical protein